MNKTKWYDLKALTASRVVRSGLILLLAYLLLIWQPKKKVTRAKKPISPRLRQFLLEQQLKLEEDAKTEVGEANETNRTLLNQLFVMAGGIIALASPILIDPGILGALHHRPRLLLVVAIVGSTVSIGSGFVQLYVELRYFQRSKRLKFAIADKIGRSEVTSIAQLRALVAPIRSKSDKSSDFFTGLQFLSLAVAAVAFVTVMAHMLLIKQ